MNVFRRGNLFLLVMLVSLQGLSCSQNVEQGSVDGGKVLRVDLGTDYREVTLDDISSSSTVTLEQLALAAWPDADLSVLDADLVGADGFRPASKPTCRELIPVHGDLLARGVLDVQTSNLVWDEELGYSGCMQVQGMQELILIGADDIHAAVDVILEQSSTSVDLQYQPSQDINGKQMVAVDVVVVASGATQSTELYFYDLESAGGIRPVEDLSAAPIEFSSLANAYVGKDDGSLFWRIFPDEDKSWDLGTLSSIHLIDRGGEASSVQVLMGEQEVQVQLGSLETVAVGAERLVPLQDVVKAAELAPLAQHNTFDFEGADGFRPSEDKALDPLTWDQLAYGWIHPVTGALTFSTDISIPSAWRVSNVAKVYILDP